MKKQLLAISMLALLILAGCDTRGPVEFDQQIVVEGYLIAGEPFGPIRVSRTAPLDATYDPADLAVRDAAVEVQMLDASGQVAARYPFTRAGFGVYLTPSQVTVRPEATYRLFVTIPGRSTPVTAQTTVPAAIHVRYASADSLVYQGPEQLEVQIAGKSASERQRVFVFTTEALSPFADNLTPFARALYDNGDVELQDLRTGSSPLLNEANYRVVDDNTIAVQLPWIAISFYGFNRLFISVVDDNYYDFRRTADVQQGGSTLAPGEIPNVLDHVDGGTGVFGSLARASTRLYVKRPPGIAGN
ncbi:MAG TPA: DUF4249 family protein [Rhodothermales bacterium]|nr:DUF4249 family protein [Rhodothermales bacterium]